MLSSAALKALARDLLQAGTPALVVVVEQVQGSTPRDAGTRMLVSKDRSWGTIGGGHLEWQAIALAQDALREHQQARSAASLGGWTQRFALGPTLGQCCGGVVHLRFDHLNELACAQWPEASPRLCLDLHGAGHVGQAIVRLLQDIDCRVRWIDQRLDDTALPGDQATIGLPTGAELEALPPHIQCLPTEDAAGEVAQAPWGSHHLVLTHRHDLDLAIVDALLRREDVISGQAWVGMIGSATKRAAFEHRLQARGHAPAVVAQLHSPIGLPGVHGKEPAVIAVSVVAQLLMSKAQP
jgi:xanthine dehydrogenase accessory factor